MMGGAFDGFISYNSQDSELVNEICSELKQYRPEIMLWIDHEQLEHGKLAAMALFEDIDRCRNLLVFVGPHGLGPYQEEEINYGLQRAHGAEFDFRMIPVFMKDVVAPRWLYGYTGVFCRRVNDRGLERLAEYLCDREVDRVKTSFEKHDPVFGDPIASIKFVEKRKLAKIPAQKIYILLKELSGLFDDPKGVCCSIAPRAGADSLASGFDHFRIHGDPESLGEELRKLTRAHPILVARIHLYALRSDQEVSLNLSSQLEDKLTTVISCCIQLNESQSMSSETIFRKFLQRFESRSVFSSMGITQLDQIVGAVDIGSYILLVMGFLSVVSWNPEHFWSIPVGLVGKAAHKWLRDWRRRRIVAAQGIVVT